MKYLLTLLLLGYFNAFSGEINLSAIPEKTCGTPVISKFSAANYLRFLEKSNPAAYHSYLNQAQEMAGFNKSAKDVRQFYGYNFSTDSHYPLTATLKRTGRLTRIWVDNQSLDKNYVNDQVLDDLLEHLENISGSNSIDSTRGIVEIDTALFGQPPNFDGDGIADFLVLDIKDDFDSTQTSSSFIAGYFSPTDQSNTIFSNKMDLMYLDAFPGIFYKGQYRTERVLSTTAHEFQHLIHYKYDKDESTWVNEGLSQLAATYCGYGIQAPGLYLTDPNIDLTHWEGEVRDYARVNLWMLYCAEQLGLPFIKELVRTPQNGIAGYSNVLNLLGLNFTFDSVFLNWTIANRLNAPDFDSRYGYQWKEARDLKANIQHTVFNFPQKNIAGDIERYGCEYHQFRGQDSLNIDFSSLPTNLFWIVQNDNRPRVTAIVGNTISEPDFSDSSRYVLVLASTQNQSYDYDTDAKYSLRYFEQAIDDGSVDLNIQFQGIAANKFTVPETGLALESIRFWNGSDDYTATIHIYDDNSINNFPGNQLITPFPVEVLLHNSWIDVDLLEPLTGLSKDKTIFVGIELPGADKSLGYDADSQTGASYLKQSGSTWRRLSDFQINNNSADGTWLIRSIFAGLSHSDSSLANHQPLVLSLPDSEAYVDAKYSYQVIAEDADGDPLQYQLITSANWLSINPNTGLLEGIPSRLNIGNVNVRIVVRDGRGGIGEQEFTLTILYDSFFLSANYPNPFTALTTIEYNILKDGPVSLKIFNILGEEVETMVEKKQKKGLHKIQWAPLSLPSGIYFCQLKSGNATLAKKISFVR